MEKMNFKIAKSINNSKSSVPTQIQIQKFVLK